MDSQNQHLIDHNYIQPDEERDDVPYPFVDHNYTLPVIANKPIIYRILPGIQRNTKIYVDDFGYKYYKKKLLVNKVTLICERQRNPSRRMCHGTASINKDETDKQISIGTPHNHNPPVIDLNVPLLRDALGERCLDPIRTESVRSIYNSEIIRHQEAAKNYTFKQTQARVKRMRRLRLRRLTIDYCS
ncbi:uncharacterized protein LOC132943013 isoform X2 [Metopolophium dirhodum]|nr:uncharacterized protein LOC132943013 isoform X2 [Metopolophium dirhodum]